MQSTLDYHYDNKDVNNGHHQSEHNSDSDNSDSDNNSNHSMPSEQSNSITDENENSEDDDGYPTDYEPEDLSQITLVENARANRLFVTSIFYDALCKAAFYYS